MRIWRSALPIGRNARGGLLIKEIQFGEDSEVYRVDMGQANLNIQPIIKEHNWDLLDAQFWFRKVQDKGYREKDGVHWVSYCTKLLNFRNFKAKIACTQELM